MPRPIDKNFPLKHGHAMPPFAPDEARLDRWLARAELILECRANGFGTPILRTLARRGHVGGMVTLANRMLDAGSSDYDPRRGILLERVIARREGLSYQLQNLSTTYRNLGDLAGYRYWLRRAERLGDPDIAAERRRFQTRFPYPIMRRYGRYRPYRKSIDG